MMIYKIQYVKMIVNHNSSQIIRSSTLLHLDLPEHIDSGNFGNSIVNLTSLSAKVSSLIRCKIWNINYLQKNIVEKLFKSTISKII